MWDSVVKNQLAGRELPKACSKCCSGGYKVPERSVFLALHSVLKVVIQSCRLSA